MMMFLLVTLLQEIENYSFFLYIIIREIDWNRYKLERKERF